MEVQDVPVSTSEEMSNTTPILQPFTSREEKGLPTVPFFDVSIVCFFKCLKFTSSFMKTFKKINIFPTDLRGHGYNRRNTYCRHKCHLFNR